MDGLQCLLQSTSSVRLELDQTGFSLTAAAGAGDEAVGSTTAGEAGGERGQIASRSRSRGLTQILPRTRLQVREIK